MIRKDLGFVLKTIRHQDRNLIVTLLTKTLGKRTVIARNGIQSKRFGGSLDLFQASEFEFEERSLDRQNQTDEGLSDLRTATVKQEYPELRKDVFKGACASVLTEILSRSTPQNRDLGDLFNLYGNALQRLQDANTPSESLFFLNASLIKMTQWLGVQPLLTRCQSCQKSLNEITGTRVHFQIDRGLWNCESCAPQKLSQHESLGRNEIEWALIAMTQPLKALQAPPSENHQTLSSWAWLEFLERHLLFHVPTLGGEPLKSLRVLRSLFSSMNP